MSLKHDDFGTFYEAINDYPPFPWQRRLVEAVGRHGGRWPAVLDLPTSAGKTSALDAAVFLLALEVTEQNGKLIPGLVTGRAAALRTFFVVDRRIVVDEAADKARKLAKRLNETSDADPEIVRDVARRLRAFGGDKALHVAVLRGGMYRDGSWAESPTQPTICLSTVDQVGSRLLFRGYGVSPYQRAVHAGLVGNDALILVDEAHLSRPFVETLKAVEFYRSERWTEQHVRTPFQVVVMSATAGDAVNPVVPPSEPLPDPIRLDDATDRNPEVCPELTRRLTAKKLARLEDVKGGDEDEEKKRAAFADALAGFARALAAPPAPPPRRPRTAAAPAKPAAAARVVGVVVNRVDTARRVFAALLDGWDAAAPAWDVILLTGRIRPYDRDRLLARWFRYMEADSKREAPPHGLLYVVATQTVEVGANLSFDALITEAAPLDALRQRFGRLDRLGQRGSSDAVVVARKDLLRGDDAVYGNRVKTTWDWLSRNVTGTGKNKRIDFGIDVLAAKLPADLAPLCAPFAHAPVMMPAHVDDWVQTTVPPEPDPDPALFLHGPKSGPPDVSVVWRSDVTEDLLDGEDKSLARKVVALVPPTSMEALPLPVWHVRKWLANRKTADANFTDLEGESEPPDGGSNSTRTNRPFLIWNGPDADDGTVVSRKPDDVHPGATIVVPSEYGGCDEFGWNPASVESVHDVGDDSSWRAKRRPVLRVHPRVAIPEFFPPAVVERIAEFRADIPVDAEPDWDTLPRHLKDVGSRFEWLEKVRPVEYPAQGGSNSPGVVLVARWKKDGWPHPDDCAAEEDPADAPADSDASSFADSFVSLAHHCDKVRERVTEYADLLGLSAHRATLARAALCHDAGKADPRFQRWLYGSEANEAKHAFALIAKSGIDSRSSVAVEAARRRAGWPKRGRHEALSVLMVRGAAAATAGIPDAELLAHLVGTHHGRGRPLWPFDGGTGAPVDEVVRCTLGGLELSADGQPRPEQALMPLDEGWVDSFWRMVGRYGYWGLAYLETLLVLADHKQSSAEREGQGG